MQKGMQVKCKFCGLEREGMHTDCISFWITRRQAISTDTSFEIKNYGENICHWNHFQIPRALSELPANWPGLTSLLAELAGQASW